MIICNVIMTCIMGIIRNIMFDIKEEHFMNHYAEADPGTLIKSGVIPYAVQGIYDLPTLTKQDP